MERAPDDALEAANVVPRDQRPRRKNDRGTAISHRGGGIDREDVARWLESSAQARSQVMTASTRDSIVEARAIPVPGRPSRYDVLFDGIRLGPKVMRNRFYQTPHCTGLGTQRPGAQARLRGVKAEGGWAVVNTEYCSIHPECDDSPWVAARLWDNNDVRNLSAMTDAVHEHESLAGVQLWYGGAVGTNLETRVPARGVSQIANDQFPAHSCYEMNLREIRELQHFYVCAAQRAVAAGFDIVIIGAQEVDNICLQFLMRFYNHRRDEYGGSLENRSRFLLETARPLWRARQHSKP
jgi:dimethylamine/trimethylamine dehydrogenase